MDVEIFGLNIYIFFCILNLYNGGLLYLIMFVLCLVYILRLYYWDCTIETVLSRPNQWDRSMVCTESDFVYYLWLDDL